ncbi:MYG1 family protein [Planctomycetes bacterium K23_9]|uniref:Uncharacterized protein n=1 Tax=Stieleria marina TaxID=1930275 RepID=A0A517NWD2_9BACT|nr:hypothetical protein K239x_34150 [Planctomycetes bacterium K23_9]
MILQKIPVSKLRSNQIFLCRDGLLYRYFGERLAILLRLTDGSEPESETIRQFMDEDLIELVPSVINRNVRRDRRPPSQGSDSNHFDMSGVAI